MSKKPHILKHLSLSGLELDYNKFAEEMSNAEYALGLLEGSQKKLQNSSLLISPLTAKEATTSSRIEGTQSDVSDVFIYEAGGQTKHADVKEVINYRKAMGLAIAELQKGREITSNLIETLHSILMKDVRHKGLKGKFRVGQVWIAEKAGDPIEKAIYVPPEPLHVIPAIDNLIEYIKSGKENVLIKAGIAHYQFEATHPFDDGNGRIGRLLIPLILHQYGRLSSPILYLSGHLDKNKDIYIRTLHDVDETGKYEDWLKFYFTSVSEQLKETQELIEEIYKLYDQVRNSFKSVKSPYIIPFIDFLFNSPIFSIQMVIEKIGCSSRLTASTLIKSFEKIGYVSQLGVEKKNKLFHFKPLIKIIK